MKSAGSRQADRKGDVASRATPCGRPRALVHKTMQKRKKPVGAFYLRVAATLDAERQRQGVLLDALGERAGLPERYMSHILRPDTPTGRIAGWDTISWIVEALWGPDYAIAITRDRP